MYDNDLFRAIWVVWIITEARCDTMSSVSTFLQQHFFFSGKIPRFPDYFTTAQGHHDFTCTRP
jgi:hypothetical protein